MEGLDVILPEKIKDQQTYNIDIKKLKFNGNNHFIDIIQNQQN